MVWKQFVARSLLSLSPKEKKYATTEHEFSALVFAVTKLHNYLFGKKFTAIVDHKPLESLIRKSQLPVKKVELSTTELRFPDHPKPGRENIADCLSRTNDTNNYVNFIANNALPISIALYVKEASFNDVTIKAVTMISDDVYIYHEFNYSCTDVTLFGFSDSIKTGNGYHYDLR